MSLLAQAAADLRSILEDVDGGFAVSIVATSPSGASATVRGIQTDHHLTINPDTGTAVSGSNVSIALSLAALAEAGIGIPYAVADRALRPWLMTFTTPTGDEQTFKVADTQPDKLGCLVCRLEAWRE